MKKWTRWEDWVAIAVGVVAAGSTFFMEQSGASMVWMLVLGILLIASGLVLFVITLLVNGAARLIIARRKEYSGANA